MRFLFLAAALFLQGDGVLFEEKCSGKLADGWTWVREEAGAWKIEDGALKVKALPGTIWYKTNTAKNLLVRKPPAAGTEAQPVALEATVENKPETNAEQVGLLLYFDDDKYVKLVRECLKGKTNVVLAREVRLPEHLPPTEVDAAAYGLRLVWAGPKVSGYYRAGDTKEWTLVGQYDTPPGDGPSFGLCVHGAAPEADRWARITGIRILKGAK